MIRRCARLPARLAAGVVLLCACLWPEEAALSAQTQDRCAAIASLKLPDTTLTSAQTVAGPQFTPTPGGTALDRLPSFCRVSGRTSPAIHFEAWLPLENWNGKFQGVGNGANAGSISYPAMAAALRRGYATASTDTGHASTNARDASWALGRPDLVADFGHRALHVTTENAKKIVESYYERAPRRSVLRRVLDRGASGAHGGAALPRRL